MLGNINRMRKPVVLAEIVLIVAVSSLILLPVLHELGHYIVGMFMGAKVNYIKFLPPSPHVSFQFTPSHAVPWVNAGGLILPSIVAACLTIAWLVTRKTAKANVHVRLLLWLPSIVLFSSNLGLFVEVTKEKDMNYHHLLFLGEHFGLSGGTLVVFQVVPAIASVGIIVFLIAMARNRSESAQPTDAPDKK